MENDYPTRSPIHIELPSPLVEIHDDRISAAGVRLYLKRDDLIHPDIPGNKWRKLKYNIEAVQRQGKSTMLTFGGAYSNHIRATAAAGSYFGLKTIGVIRGEEHLPLNTSLAYAASRGMRLVYMDRLTYRHKDEPTIVQRLCAEYGDFYLLPEGGSNSLGLKGCAELSQEITQPFHVICCACGTGGTLAGISAGLLDGQTALGFSVLKGGEFLRNDIERLQQEAFGVSFDNYKIETSFHFGGYAKRAPELDSFITAFEHMHSLRLDWVYEAKMMYGVYALAERGYFAPGTILVAVIAGPGE